MARIPGSEGLGELVARPMRLAETQVQREAFGAGIAGSMLAVGDAMQRDQAIADAEARRAAREAAAERRAAERAQAIGAMHRMQDGLLALGDEVAEGVRTGSLDKTQAGDEWGKRAREAISAGMADVPAEHRQAVQQDLEHRSAMILRTGVGRAVRQRDRDDTKAGLAQTLEHAQRLYLTDPAAADEMVTQALDSLGPFAGMGPDDIQRSKQTWREGAQYTRAFEAISTARNDRKGLAAAEKLLTELPDLDPQRRAVLADRIAGYRLAIDQRAELEAARAQRQAEAALKRAEGVFTAATTLADKGTLQPEYVQQVIGQLTGTPYQAAFSQLVEQQRATAPLAAQPIAVQRATLDALNAKIAAEGLTPDLERRRGQVEAVLRGAEADLKADPLRAGLERGVITGLAPVDTSSPQALATTVAQRLVQAQTVSTWAGVPVSPLTEQETVGVKGMLDALPAKERSGAVAAIAQALGPQAAAGLARQIDPKDKALALAFGYGGAATTAGRNVSELILRGEQARKDGTSTKNEKAAALPAAQWERFMATEIADLYQVQTLADDTRQAALLIAHGMAAEQGGALSEADMQRAVRMAVGGPVIEHNGRRIPLPAGMTADALRQRLQSVDLQPQTGGHGVIAAGVRVPTAEFAKHLPGQQLIYAGPGRYNVLVGGRPVTNAQGRRIVIGVQ